MGESSSSVQHKIDSAGDLKSVVRTMKAMAAANINQYENAVTALDDYFHTVQLGLLAYFRNASPIVRKPPHQRLSVDATDTQKGIIVIGSDQGLVGQFNDALLTFMRSEIASFAHDTLIWTVGERIHTHLEDSEFTMAGSFTLPNSINTVTSLVTELLQEILLHQQQSKLSDVYVVFNRSLENAQYAPRIHRILPMDSEWQQSMLNDNWPTNCVPQVLVKPTQAFSALVGEYLFTSLYRACVESLASENASRLTAMQRAEKNIDELQTALQRRYHRQRQSAIDEELQDLVSGFEALLSATSAASS